MHRLTSMHIRDAKRENCEISNILLRGGKKYNKTKRKKQRKIEKSKSKKVTFRWQKKKGLKVQFGFSNKVPLIVFGDKHTVKFKGLTSGVMGILRKKLQKGSCKSRKILEKSMLSISRSMWSGNGGPTVLCRQKSQ
ncbi:hypothetical protein EDC94DRAFT_591014 [Helicostylum pulchrum]|nr:hypothetical protein EDC94DRAFT_591014 [Helicostylum pulchrum]